jgi:hypothetical protein
MRQSKGHLVFIGGYEYYKGDKYIWKADVMDPIECTGRRECGKFYCTIAAWDYSPIYRQAVKEALEKVQSNQDQAERSAMVS